jgi:DNA-binding NarL/FixJ family response regulator
MSDRSDAGPPLVVALFIADPEMADRVRSGLAGHPRARLATDAADEEAELVIADTDPGPDQPVLALLREPTVPPSWEAKLRGVLPDDVGDDVLRAAVDAIAAGLAVVSPDWLRDAARRAVSIPALEIELTEREHQVLDLLATGEPNKAIARRLGISPATVKFHVAALLGKLGAHSRSEVAAIALRRGLVML